MPLKLLGAPITAPIAGFEFILRQLQELAERELYDEDRLREELLELHLEADEIFEPHVRLESRSGDDSPTGSGLGLYISKGIIRAHRGEIWAESVQGQGTTFKVTIPAQSPKGKAQGPKERTGHRRNDARQ